MRTLIILVALIPLLASPGADPLDRSFLWKSEEACGHILPDEILRAWPRDEDYGYDVEHIDLDLTVDFDESTIAGMGTLVITVEDAGLTVLGVDLDDALTVDAVTLDGMPHVFAQTPDQVEITLLTPPAVGAQLEVAIAYYGTPAEVGNKSMKFRLHSGIPLVYTISTPYSNASATVIPISHYWRPCKDVPDDKSTFSLSMTIPEEMLACSNGLMTTNVNHGNGTRTVSWEHNYPVAPYLVTLAATNYMIIEDTYTGPGGSAAIEHYVFPEIYSQAMVSFDIVPEAMGCFAGLYGEYPFIGEKYGMFATLPGPAVEEQTMVAYPSNLINGSHTYDWIVVHELAHMWWGDCVTCVSWEHVWLNEGLASYSEALWREHHCGFQGLRAYMLDMDNGPYAGTIYDPPYIWSAIVYEKAAWVFHMLRHILGDDGFFQFLNEYRAAHEHGSAATDDLIAAAEAVHGADLDWFFNPWIYAEGRPTYEYSWTHHGAGPYTVTLGLRQIQSPSFPTYTMPIDVAVQTTAGTEVTTVLATERMQWFALEVADEPLAVTLDPDDWILADFLSGTAGLSESRGAELSFDLTGPNPFDRRTTWRLTLSHPGQVAVRLFDMQGRMVRTLLQGALSAGSQQVVWDGKDDAGARLPAGVYLCRLVANAGVAERRVVLLH